MTKSWEIFFFEVVVVVGGIADRLCVKKQLGIRAFGPRVVSHGESD